jgi:hypothetical protein
VGIVTVLDTPRVDTIILDETILDDTVECRLQDAAASWLWVMRCCGTETMLCDGHDANAFTGANKAILEAHRYWLCDHCGADFGYRPRLSEICDRRPI